MDGFGTEKRAECKIHMGEGRNTVCMSLALNFKNNSDQQLFFFSAQLTADKHNTHWTTAFVHWGTEEFSQLDPLLPEHPSHPPSWVAATG